MATAAQSELDVIVRGDDQLSPELQKLESRVIRMVGAISASLAAIKIGAAPITAAAEFERELANITKTTNFTQTQIDQLSTSLLNMSLRVNVSANDLAKIAAAAGQQGLGKQGVEGVAAFTESVARMASVLDLTAEESSRDIGKILNIFHMSTLETEKAISVFNQVSNNSTASGKELLDVVKRIGDASGTIKLEGATALAAAAIDLGASPEVAGTAMAKMFAQMFQNAKELGRLMHMSATDWISTLQTDGIGAFKQLLSRLRELEPESQVTTISKLLGGGRIGALIQKFVNDSSNAVLDKELQNATTGSQTGTSALREQATVMKTLMAQVELLKNSVFKLGADAGEQLLRPLAIYASEIAKAVQSPAIQSFAAALVGSFGDVLQLIANTVTAMSQLNVNWENFLKVIQLFIGLKIGSVFLSLAQSIPGVSSALALVGVNARAAAAGLTATGEAATSSSIAQAGSQNKVIEALKKVTGYYSDLGVLIRNHNTQVKEQIALEQQLTQRQEALNAASAQENVARGLVGRGNVKLSNASNEVANQGKALLDAEQRGQQALSDIRFQQQQREEAQAQAHNARLLAIEEEYQAQRVAVGGSRNSKAQIALRETRDAELAAEEASNARSIRGIQQYYDNRYRIVQTSVERELAAQRELLARANTQFDTIYQQQQTRLAALTQAQAQTASAQGLVAATQGKLTPAESAAKTFDPGPPTIYSRAVALVTTVMNGAAIAGNVFAAAIRTIGAALSVVARIAVGAFFWVTILFSIADALGIVGKLGEGFQRLTDAIGLTSKAMRDEKIAQDASKKAAEEHAKVLQDLIDKYAQLKDINTGTVTQDFVQKQINVLGAPDATLEAKQQSVRALLDAARGAQAELEKVGQNGEKLDQSFQKSLADQTKKLTDARNEITRLTAEIAATPPLIQADSLGLGGNTTALLETQLDAAKKKAQDAATAIAGMKNGLSDTGTLARQANESLLNIAKGFSQVLTTQGNEQFKAQAQDLLDAAKAYAEAKTQAATIASDPKLAGTEDGARQQKEALDNVTKTQNALQNVQDTIRNLSKKFEDMKGVPPEVLKSLRDLTFFANLGEDQITALSGVIDVINKNGIQATGKLAGALNPTTPTQGKDNFKPQNTEAEARKEARARLQLALAEGQAAINLNEEKNKQILDRDKFFYDQGLKDIRSYYDERQRIQLTSLSNEISIKEKELAQAQFELKGADQKSEQLKFQADIVKINGQIAVLQERKKAVAQDRAQEETLAIKAFNDHVLQQENALAENLVIPRSVEENNKFFFAELLRQYETFLNQLEANGQGDLASKLRLQFNFDAVKRSLNPLKAQMDIAFGQVDRYKQSLDLLTQQGAVTSQQAEAALTAAIQQQMPILQERLRLMQSQLTTELQMSNPDLYAQIAAGVDEVRLRMQQLGAETDKTAKTFNASITDNLANALGELEPTFASVKNAAIGFLRDIAKEAQKVLGKDLAEQFMQFINGGNSAGGIGGFIQSILQGGAPGIPAGSIASKAQSAVASSAVQFGTTPLNPLYVSDVNKFGAGAAAGLLGPTADQQQALDDLITKKLAQDSAGTATDAATTGLTDSLSSTFDGITSTLTDIFNGLADNLSSLFSGLGSMLSSIFSSGGSGGEWLSGLMSIFAVAHTGGVIGSSGLQTRMASPAILRNALRYHTGGIAGLAPDEVPAILRKGEEVLTQNDPRHRANNKADPTASAGPGQNIRNVLVVDRDFVPSAMQSAQGEQVIMTMLSKNAATVRRIIGKG